MNYEFVAFDPIKKKIYSGDEIEQSKTIKTYLSYGKLTIGCFPKNEDYYELVPLMCAGNLNGVKLYEHDVFKIVFNNNSCTYMILRFNQNTFGFATANISDLKYEYHWDIWKPLTPNWQNILKEYKIEKVGNSLLNSKLLKLK